jgi:hypothetical protein
LVAGGACGGELLVGESVDGSLVKRNFHWGRVGSLLDSVVGDGGEDDQVADEARLGLVLGGVAGGV